MLKTNEQQQQQQQKNNKKSRFVEGKFTAFGKSVGPHWVCMVLFTANINI